MFESDENEEMHDRLRRSAEMSASPEARMRHRVWDRARGLGCEAEGPVEGLGEGPPEGLVEVRREAGSKLMPSSIAPSRAEVQGDVRRLRNRRASPHIAAQNGYSLCFGGRATVAKTEMPRRRSTRPGAGTEELTFDASEKLLAEVLGARHRGGLRCPIEKEGHRARHHDDHRQRSARRPL